MILEIKFLGFRLVLDPKTVEALLAFFTERFDGHTRDEKSASTMKTLE